MKNQKPISKKEKSAVRIAKDVLLQLDLRSLVATQGTYLHAPDAEFKIGDLQSQLVGKNGVAGKLKKKCNVCAIGSMFVAKVARDNTYRVGSHNEGDGWRFNDDDMRDLLKEAFTTDELIEIEDLFEKGEDSAFDDICELFTHLNAEQRLRILMGEVIRQGGNFSADEFDGFIYDYTPTAEVPPPIVGIMLKTYGIK